METLFVDPVTLKEQVARKQDALEWVRQGGIVIFRGGLQEIGFQKTLEELTNQEIALHCTPEQTEQIARLGFEKIHEVITPQQIFDVNVGLTERLRPEAGKLIASFAHNVLGLTKRVFIYGLPVVRFFVPHDHFARNRALFTQRQGFLSIQGPHHDTWFDHATESLNVWMAIGRVLPGNGMSIYPDHWGKTLKHDGTRQMPRAQALGRSVNFDLQPGDVVFFHGETLHSSELNVTNETRYVLTNRFTLARPKFTEFDQWHNWYDSRLLGGSLSPLAVWPTYFSTGYFRYLLKSNRLSRFLRGKRKKAAPASANPLGAEAAPETANPGPRLDSLAIGEIQPLSKNRCVVRTEEGAVAFSRFCPHEGADLANATYRDGKIFCPWHNLSFDSRTGHQPCETIKDLKTFPTECAEDGTIRMAAMASNSEVQNR